MSFITADADPPYIANCFYKCWLDLPTSITQAPAKALELGFKPLKMSFFFTKTPYKVLTGTVR